MSEQSAAWMTLLDLVGAAIEAAASEIRVCREDQIVILSHCDAAKEVWEATCRHENSKYVVGIPDRSRKPGFVRLIISHCSGVDHDCIGKLFFVRRRP